jgi:hypothetical protein
MLRLPHSSQTTRNELESEPAIDTESMLIPITPEGAEVATRNAGGRTHPERDPPSQE